MRLPMLAWLAVGCVPMEPSGTPFVPVRVTAPAPAPSASPGRPIAKSPGPTSGFDFEAEDRDEGAIGGLTDPLALQAKLLGVTPPDRPAPAPTPPPAVAAAPVVVPVWDPDKPLPEASFGVRVLATLLEMEPPRALLGMPDGSERVVQPGAMLADHRLIVLAIGRDAVQIAEIKPQGFYASVNTQTVRALYPQAVATP